MTGIIVSLRDSDKGISIKVETPEFVSQSDNKPASVELQHGDHIALRMSLASAKSVAYAINAAIESWALSKAIEKFPHMSDSSAQCTKEEAEAFAAYKKQLLMEAA